MGASPAAPASAVHCGHGARTPPGSGRRGRRPVAPGRRRPVRVLRVVGGSASRRPLVAPPPRPVRAKFRPDRSELVAAYGAGGRLSIGAGCAGPGRGRSPVSPGVAPPGPPPPRGGSASGCPPSPLPAILYPSKMVGYRAGRPSRRGPARPRPGRRRRAVKAWRPGPARRPDRSTRRPDALRPRHLARPMAGRLLNAGDRGKAAGPVCRLPRPPFPVARPDAA